MPSRLRRLWVRWCGALPGRGPCLYHWRPRQGKNFGDELSFHFVLRLVQRALGPAFSLPRCAGLACRRRRLLAVGSILHESRPGDVVWGSGINGKVGSRGYDFSGIDFRAVRGPLTRELVVRNGGACPAVYGDPALLLPRLFPELVDEAQDADAGPGTGRPVYLPNLNDAALTDRRDIQALGFDLVEPTSPWTDVARAIRSAPLVVGSSLHGIVLADALGRACRPTLSLFEAPLKFEDYFLSTGRDHVNYPRTLREALDLGPLPEPVIDLDSLLEAFPLDIFSGGPPQ